MNNKAQHVKDLIFTAGLGAVLGGLIGLGLSFTALSPLVIGGIIGSMLPILPTVFTALPSAVTVPVLFGSENGGKEAIKASIMYFGTLTAISVGIGVGLAAAIVSIFPGAMLGMQSLALIGAAIGAITPVIAVPVMNHAIVPVAEKVDKNIISPMFEKVFSSKEQERAV
ncbi:hypothetical protein [Wolbachia pipientis]|uniref:hypothetical protein n=1 Tax=Wolbachia pipientis TaxID=955 RepID=UPI002030E053|nr:hypothetical protein [Wolbachia pipientis]MCM1001819.1 hypothetical protein [Wolbachia pipientis]